MIGRSELDSTVGIRSLFLLFRYESSAPRYYCRRRGHRCPVYRLAVLHGLLQVVVSRLGDEKERNCGHEGIPRDDDYVGEKA